MQDGLIVLHMEANHVEAYLQSARDTQLSKRASLPENNVVKPLLPSMQENYAHLGEKDAPVLRVDDELIKISKEVDEEEEETLAEEGGRSGPSRRQIYQPCTIPLRRDCTNLLHVETEGEKGFGTEDNLLDINKAVRFTTSC